MGLTGLTSVSENYRCVFTLAGCGIHINLPRTFQKAFSHLLRPTCANFIQPYSNQIYMRAGRAQYLGPVQSHAGIPLTPSPMTGLFSGTAKHPCKWTDLTIENSSWLRRDQPLISEAKFRPLSLVIPVST